MTFSTKLDVGTKLSISIYVTIESYNSLFSAWGMIKPGNRSLTIALNSGISCDKNFGILASLIALTSTTSSDRLTSALFNDPAITNSDFTALIPKS